MVRNTSFTDSREALSAIQTTTNHDWKNQSSIVSTRYDYLPCIMHGLSNAHSRQDATAYSPLRVVYPSCLQQRAILTFLMERDGPHIYFLNFDWLLMTSNTQFDVIVLSGNRRTKRTK
jgi:hypothetical protein